MKFRLKKKKKKKKGKTKPGMWPGSRVPVQSKYENEEEREQVKYTFKCVNVLEPGEWIVAVNGSYALTVTGKHDTNGDVEIEGIFATGELLSPMFVKDWTPYRVDSNRHKEVMKLHEAGRRRYTERDETQLSKKPKKKKKGAFTVDYGDDSTPKKKFKLKIKPKKKKLKLKLRRG